MRFVVLASGSKGNALVVQGGGVTLLVDCGLTPKALRARLFDVGLSLTELDALLVTHGHGDHTKGAGRLAGPMRLRTYATPPTTRYLARAGGLVNFVPIEPGARFSVGRLHIHAFPTPHDAPGSVGFVLDDGHARLGICTDLGHPDADVARALTGCDLLYLEFNHDLEMLKRGPYPASLKRRVASDRGHLSNDQAATLLGLAKTPRLTRVVLAHLSETNNTPALALDAAARVVDEREVHLVVAPQHEPSRWFEVGEGRTPSRAPRRAFDEELGPEPGPELVPELVVEGVAARGASMNGANARRADKLPPIRYGSTGLVPPARPSASLRTGPVRRRAVATSSVAVTRQLSLFGGPTGSNGPGRVPGSSVGSYPGNDPGDES